MNDQNDTIRQLAYALWEARGSPPSSGEVDWLAAEQQVRGHVGHPKVPVNELGTWLLRDITSLEEDGIVNPIDGRGALRRQDDQGDKLPLQSNL